MKDLEGKVGLVTGSGRGLGRACGINAYAAAKRGLLLKPA